MRQAYLGATVRRPIDGSLKTRRIDEGFQQQQPLAEALLPIRGKALLAQGQHARAKIRAVPRRKNQACLSGFHRRTLDVVGLDLRA